MPYGASSPGIGGSYTSGYVTNYTPVAQRRINKPGKYKINNNLGNKKSSPRKSLGNKKRSPNRGNKRI